MKRGRSQATASVVSLVSDLEEDEEAAAAKASAKQLPRKRAKPAAASSKAAGKKPAKPTTRQATLTGKGFGALLFSSSQGVGPTSQSPPPTPRASPSALQHLHAPPQVEAADEDPTLWVDKHEPTTAEDLAVHKAKVGEVRSWLEGYLEFRRRAPSRVLLITGPTGCCKSTTVRVLAADLGFDLVEWTPPLPTLWTEHQYQGSSGLQYHSKLDDFESFIARSKFAALPLSVCSAAPPDALQTPSSSQQLHTSSQQAATQRHAGHQHPQQQQQQQQQKDAGQRPAQGCKLLLVDDLPFVHDAERRQRLVGALNELAATSRCPVVIISTECVSGGPGRGGSGGSGGGGGSSGMYGAASGHAKGLHKDVLAALEAMGASTITFNPLTALNTAKALKRIAEAEGLQLAPEAATAVAEAAAGDLRNAISTLQLGFGRCAAARAAAKAKGAQPPAKRRRGAKKASSAAAAGGAGGSASAAHLARDQSLSLFHALGKLLHHKREAPDPEAASGSAPSEDAAPSSGSCGSQQRPAPRGPLRINPDAVVAASALDAATIASFLHENYPHFIDAEEGAGDVADVAAALSDAVLLACHRGAAPSNGFWDEDDGVASTLQDAAAATVAARGLLAGNAHPAPPRWLPLRGPAAAHVERAAASNEARLAAALRTTAGVSQCRAAQGSGGAVAAQVLPYLRLLAPWPSHAWLQQLLPPSWSVYWNGSVSERASVPGAGGGAAGSELARALQAASLGTQETGAEAAGEQDEIEDED